MQKRRRRGSKNRLSWDIGESQASVKLNSSLAEMLPEIQDPEVLKKFPKISLAEDLGQVHEKGIFAISCSQSYLYTSDFDGHMKRFTINDPKTFRDYGKIDYKTSIFRMLTTNDDKWVFVAHGYGF